MAEYQLHCFAESGNSYKAALMLHLAGCDWEPVRVDFFAGETRGDRFRAEVSEMGEAPVLVHEGERMSQSGVILDYLAERTGKFAPRDARERREVWRWILWDNHKFTSYYATLRFLAALTRNGDPVVIEFMRGRARSAFAIADKHLASQPFLVGDRPTIADLSMAGYMFYTEETGIDFKSYPHLFAWIGRIAGLPGWKPPHDLMPAAAPASPA